MVSSSKVNEIREDLQYTKEDIKAVEEWVKRHVETTWHSEPPHLSLSTSHDVITSHR